MMTISIYDETGKITGVISGDESVIQDIINTPEFPTISNLSPGIPAPPATRLWIEGDWLDKPVYVLDGAITDRPANPATLAGLSLSSLPVPCEIIINGTQYPCTDDHAELTFDQPGTYTVVVCAWPRLDKEFTIEN